MSLPLLVIATGNRHKVAEIAEILEDVARVEAVAEMPPVDENATDFTGNAALKALAVHTAPGVLVLADDSGLEVDALDGRPGVHTARYAGPGTDDTANRAKLLAELERVGACGPEQRQARFRCSLVLARDGKLVAGFDGSCEGWIAVGEAGEGGFGYDPLFIPERHEKTFAELPAATKHALSHRGRALEQLRQWLDNCNQGR